MLKMVDLIWAQGGQSKVNGGFDARLANSVRYDSPNFGGFTGGIQYSAAEGAASPSSSSGSLPKMSGESPMLEGYGLTGRMSGKKEAQSYGKEPGDPPLSVVAASFRI